MSSDLKRRVPITDEVLRYIIQRRGQVRRSDPVSPLNLVRREAGVAVPLGRGVLLTSELQARIVQWVENGNYLSVAARGVGIGVATLQRWLAKGRAGDEAYVEFLEAVEQAQALGELGHVDNIKRQSGEDWHASIEVLSRKHPDRWAKTQRVAHTGPDGGAIEIHAWVDLHMDDVDDDVDDEGDEVEVTDAEFEDVDPELLR